MYILVYNENHAVVDIGSEVIMEHGNYVVADNRTAYPTQTCTLYETDVSEGICPQKYCYTPSEGFYPNPTWEEANKWDLPNSIVQEIKDAAIGEVQQEVINNADRQTAETGNLA